MLHFMSIFFSYVWLNPSIAILDLGHLYVEGDEDQREKQEVDSMT